MIVSRKDWGAQYGQGLKTQEIERRYVVVHHTGTSYSADTNWPQIVRNIEHFHAGPKPGGRGWAGIGYSFLIAPDGSVYEGRGWHRYGAHAPGFNRSSYGVAFIGNHDTEAPTAEAMASLQALVRYGVKHGYLARAYRALGHREVRQTQCPGNALQREIPQYLAT